MNTLANIVTGIFKRIKDAFSVHFHSSNHVNKLFLNFPGSTIHPQFTQQNIPIVFASDKHYFPYFLVALESIVQNSTTQNNYDILLLHTDLTKKDLTIAQRQIRHHSNFSIRFIDVSDLVNQYHLNDLMVINHLQITAYYRLLISHILAQYDKILYLDCDLVVMQDVANLFQTNLDTYYVAAVLDVGVQIYFLPKVPEFEPYIRSLGMKEPNKYFNSGVLVMNLSLIRKHSLTDKFIHVARKNNRFFHDQNVLNVVCNERVFLLNPEWNLQCCNTIQTNTFGIIHYCGDKPWDTKKVNLYDRWWRYAKHTHFYKQFRQHYKKRNPITKKLLFQQISCQILYKLTRGNIHRHYKQKYKSLLQ